jgi:hypothetical protein
MPNNWSRRQVLAGAAAFAGLAAVSGCASPPPPAPAIPEIRFNDAPPIRLDVAAIDITDEAPSAPASPDWGNVFPTLPRTAMRNWGEDRLAAEPSATGLARFRIVEALVSHRMGEPVKGVFKAPRRETFTVRVAGVLDVPREAGKPAGTASANAWGEESLEVDTEPYARKQALDGLVRRVMADFDREMERAIRANMADLLR